MLPTKYGVVIVFKVKYKVQSIKYKVIVFIIKKQATKKYIEQKGF